MVQIFKDIRTKAVAVLEEMSATLVKLAEEGATVDSRKAFVESCKPVWDASGVSISQSFSASYLRLTLLRSCWIMTLCRTFRRRSLSHGNWCWTASVKVWSKCAKTMRDIYTCFICSAGSRTSGHIMYFHAFDTTTHRHIRPYSDVRGMH